MESTRDGFLGEKTPSSGPRHPYPPPKSEIHFPGAEPAAAGGLLCGAGGFGGVGASPGAQKMGGGGGGVLRSQRWVDVPFGFPVKPPTPPPPPKKREKNTKIHPNGPPRMVAIPGGCKLTVRVRFSFLRGAALLADKADPLFFQKRLRRPTKTSYLVALVQGKAFQMASEVQASRRAGVSLVPTQSGSCEWNMPGANHGIKPDSHAQRPQVYAPG